MNNIESRKMSVIGPIGLCMILLVTFLLGYGGTSQAQTGLRGKVSDICFRCHADVKRSLSDSSVHFPFRDGQCTSCHNPHVSGMKALMKEEINPLCLSCHNNIKERMEKANVHGALRGGVCTDCHKAHSANNKYLLASAEKDLCWTCHENLKEESKRLHAHVPFNGGQCSSCHDAHASIENYQLVDSPNKLCQECHQPGCNVGGVSITSITKDMDCVKCHTGHNSDAQGLLGPYGHAAFLDKACTNCHNPIKTGAAISTKIEGSALCFQCHEKKPENFRDNDVHGQGMKNPCTLCHEYHGSKNTSLTVGEREVCLTCHAATDKRISFMIRALKGIRCAPVRDRKCFECHKPLHSKDPYYLVAEPTVTCTKCHEAQHRVTHPLGEGVIDPRDGKVISCLTCHSMHSARADFMLRFDRKRELCIQCHKT